MPVYRHASLYVIAYGHILGPQIKHAKGACFFHAQVRQVAIDFTPCTSARHMEYCGGDVVTVHVAHGVVSFLWGVHNTPEFGVIFGILSFVRMVGVGVEHGGVVAFGGLRVVDESIVGL